jgi:hypothetical protein
MKKMKKMKLLCNSDAFFFHLFCGVCGASSLFFVVFGFFSFFAKKWSVGIQLYMYSTV